MGVRRYTSWGVVSFKERGTYAWPFLIHSNGHHHVLTDDDSGLKELLDVYDPPPPKLMNHPVVLVDTAEHGPCNVTTIGWLMNATRWPEGAPRLRLK